MAAGCVRADAVYAAEEARLISQAAPPHERAAAAAEKEERLARPRARPGREEGRRAASSHHHHHLDLRHLGLLLRERAMPGAPAAASGVGVGRPSETLVRLEQTYEGDLDGFTAPPPSEGSEHSSEERAAGGDGRNDGDGDDDDDGGDDDNGNRFDLNDDDDDNNNNNKNSEFAQTRYNRAGVPDQRRNLMTLDRLQMQDETESDENESSGARAPSNDEFAAAVTSTLYQEPKPIDTALPPHFQPDRSPLLANAQEAIDDAELDAWLLDGRDSAPALCCAGCCSLFSFLVVLFATITPFWVWNTGSDSYLFGDVTTSTGGYTATSQTLTGSFSLNRSFVRQWTYWTAMPVMEGVCSNETTTIFGAYTSGSMYDDWGGKYGFCSQVDGELSTPSALIALQVCSTFAVLATLLSSCVSCATPTSGRWAARTAGSFSLVGSALALSSLSIAAAFPWYKDLRAGVGFLPIRYIHDATEVEGVIAIKQPPMSFGPAFYGMVIASFVCLLSAGLFFVTLRKPTEQEYVVWRSVPALRDTSHHTTDTTAEEVEEHGNESGKVIELTQISTVAQV